MAINNKLFTIRSWYENKSKTGIILTASATVNGYFETVKIYVPYNSNYDTSAIAQIPLTQGYTSAMVKIPQRKTFDRNNEEL